MKRIVTKKSDNVVQFDKLTGDEIIAYTTSTSFMLGYRDGLLNEGFYSFFNLTRYTNEIRVKAGDSKSAIKAMLEKYKKEIKLSDFVVFDSMKEVVEFAHKFNSKQE